MNENSDHDVSNQDVALYRRATGCPIFQARPTLMTMAPLLRERVLLACLTHTEEGSGLRDPIEQMPEFRDVVSTARTEAQETVLSRGQPLRRGSGFLVWEEQARLLRERHQITWFSPREMNPAIVYD